MNLLKETLGILIESGKTENDVKWVGTLTHKCSWQQFKVVADTEYISGYGAPEVAQDLLIVGDNWWLERRERDGSEWWDYKEMPKEPAQQIRIKAVTIRQASYLGYDISCGWEDLTSINNIDQDQ